LQNAFTTSIDNVLFARHSDISGQQLIHSIDRHTNQIKP